MSHGCADSVDARLIHRRTMEDGRFESWKARPCAVMSRLRKWAALPASVATTHPFSILDECDRAGQRVNHVCRDGCARPTQTGP